MGPTSPGTSGSMPGRGFLSIASACRGMSGRLHASGAGDKSSVLVSPPTLKTDRKSTRLNSSHVAISYAVFCLKKKNKDNNIKKKKIKYNQKHYNINRNKQRKKYT